MKPLGSYQVLVFRSNIDSNKRVKLVSRELLKLKGVCHVNVDLDDWEKVLRVECIPIIQARVIEKQLSDLGFECSELTH